MDEEVDSALWEDTGNVGKDETVEGQYRGCGESVSKSSFQINPLSIALTTWTSRFPLLPCPFPHYQRTQQWVQPSFATLSPYHFERNVKGTPHIQGVQGNSTKCWKPLAIPQGCPSLSSVSAARVCASSACSMRCSFAVTDSDRLSVDPRRGECWGIPWLS